MAVFLPKTRVRNLSTRYSRTISSGTRFFGDTDQQPAAAALMLGSLHTEGVRRMTEPKLAPNLPGWMVEHANRYLSSGGTDGHMYKPTQPGRSDITVPSLLLTTTGRKSGEKFIFPLYYGKAGDSYIVVAPKGGAPNTPAGTATFSP